VRLVTVCAEIFERRRHFNVPVQWARHPDLREYIHSAVTNLQPWIQQVSIL
jgi:mitotic spindle assembly checkpoint protein MAD2B